MAGQYITLNGVKTYYEVEGNGSPVVLLHGGAAPIETLSHQRRALAHQHRVYMPERRAQGRTPDVDGPLSYEAMVDDTIAFLEDVVGGPAALVGWSDGANVALLLALRRPGLATRIASISANVHVNGMTDWCIRAIGKMSRENFPKELAELCERTSPDGPGHFPVVLEKLKTLWLSEPSVRPEELAAIGMPALVMAADNDIVTHEHTVAMYRALPNGQLCIVPETSHNLINEKPDVVNRALLDFLASPAKQRKK